jgi:hypothetical protein
MVKVKRTQPARVLLEAGREVEVDEREAKRLLTFNLAEKVKKTAPKKAAKKE